ncbi:hypothetical protein PV733_27385 [Streptomyces europaeiscabiei]|uniref:hypothetical protein n=1 Tax=Streptomyces europaeiscabiei TaxID=146819 RepID=UPI0029A4949F|nr:hypothetical protein [Streptomyces europaeiscabiei]MDX3712601.1 hypothetical protein [Streptomyces europaeiscabiei]
MNSNLDKPASPDPNKTNGLTIGPDPKAAYGLAKDAISTIITLSSGILGLSLTFSKNWAGDAASDDRWMLETSWALFLVSVLFGVISMLMLAGISREGGNIDRKALRHPCMIQIVLFLIALGFFVAFGFSVL